MVGETSRAAVSETKRRGQMIAFLLPSGEKVRGTVERSGRTRNGFDYIMSGQWWITVIPSIVLIILILAINLLGDWLRDALNPKLYKET